MATSFGGEERWEGNRWGQLFRLCFHKDYAGGVNLGAVGSSNSSLSIVDLVDAILG